MEDASGIVKYADNIKVASNLTDAFPYPYTLENARDFIGRVIDMDPPQILAIATPEEAIGSIGCMPQQDVHRKNAELGYWLAEPFWGRGIATLAVIRMVQYGFETFDITRIFARPYGFNLASQRVLEKAGFRLEARFRDALIKNGVFTDELIYAIRREENS